MFGDRYAIDMELLQASREWHGLSLSARGVYITMLPHMITKGPFVGFFAEKDDLSTFLYDSAAAWVAELCGVDVERGEDTSKVEGALEELHLNGFISFLTVSKDIERPRALHCHLIQLSNRLGL